MCLKSISISKTTKNMDKLLIFFVSLEIFDALHHFNYFPGVKDQPWDTKCITKGKGSQEC